MLRTRLLVLAARKLRDHTFEPMIRNGLEEIQSATFDVIRVPNPSATAGNQFSQDGLALNEREFHQTESVQIEQVECVEVDRDVLVRSGNILRTRQMYSRLDRLKVRMTVFVECNDFAV